VYYKAPNGRIKEYFCPKCDSLTEIKCVDKNTMVEGKEQCLVDVLCRDNPRWSWSMGASTPEEAETMKKEHPDRVYNKDGQLLIRNRQHKKVEMKRHKMSERS